MLDLLGLLVGLLIFLCLLGLLGLLDLLCLVDLLGMLDLLGLLDLLCLLDLIGLLVLLSLLASDGNSGAKIEVEHDFSKAHVPAVNLKFIFQPSNFTRFLNP